MRNTLFKSLSKEIIFAVLFAVIALISFSLFFFPSQTTRKVQEKVTITPGSTAIPNPSSTIIPTKSKESTEIEPTEENTQESQTVQITVIVTPTPPTQIASDKAIIHVTITGVSSFDISLDKGKNQCDVLTQAKNDGKISQLLMKYDSSLDSYGVYQINSLGKDNSVWWTYDVNGKSPNMGCNHVAANSGDSVAWKYIGQ